MLLVLPFIILSSLLFEGKQGLDVLFIFLKLWAGIFCALCGFRVRIRKNPGFIKGRPYIYVCNHSSYLDAVAAVAGIPGSFKPLGKIEMAKIPLFGMIYRRVVVMIDRSSKESRAESVEQLRRDLASGQSVLIFPEGTMNRTGMSLTDFYDGAFRLAIETQTPICPVVLLNTRDLLPRTDPLAARPGTMTCLIDNPVDVADLTSDDIGLLKDEVHHRMKGLIETGHD